MSGTYIGDILEYDIDDFLLKSVNDVIDNGKRFTIVDKSEQKVGEDGDTEVKVHT